MTGQIQKFSPLAQAFHWSVAALILFQIPLAYYMIDLPLSPDKLASYALHKSLGLTIFALGACRLAWRLVRPAPPLDESIGDWQRRLARLTQAVLYALILAMPLIGWLSSSAANFPVSLFKLVTLPDLVAPDPQLHEWLELTHRLMAYTLSGLVTLHIIAAVHHHVVRRDNVLIAMLPFVKSR